MAKLKIIGELGKFSGPLEASELKLEPATPKPPLEQKIDQNDLEDKLIKLAEERFSQGKYKIFDRHSRLIRRHKLLGLDSASELALLILNREGEAIILTEEFERELLRVLKIRYEK